METMKPEENLSAKIAEYILLKKTTKQETLEKQEEKRLKTAQGSAEEEAIKAEFEAKRETLG